MPRFVPGTDLFSAGQRFGSFCCWQVPAFPVSKAEVEDFAMPGVPECLCGAGSPATAPTIEDNLATFGKIIDVLIHLIHWNVNRIRYRTGRLNFAECADVNNHQSFCSLNLLL